jgi:peptidyl-prolyl cis-trans isomerase D
MTMLDRMRRHKGWLKWFLGLVAVAMCLYLIPDFLGNQTSTSTGGTPTDVLAEVDGRAITARDFDTRYQSTLQQYRSQFGAGVSETLLKQLRIDQQVLRQLVEEQLEVSEAARQGIRITNDELAAQIMSLPVFQEGGQFVGDQRYRQMLLSFNPPLTVSQFEEDMRRGLVLERLRTSLTGWVAVSDAEIEREYRQRNEKVKLQVAVITASTFQGKVTASDADIAAHFDSHKETFRVGEQRRIRYFVIDPALARLKVVVTPNEIQRDYSNDIDRYRTPEQVRASQILFKTDGKTESEVRARAEGVLKQLQGGADFAALAKKVSEDEGSKATGGDLGFQARGRISPEFDTAAFALEKDKISDLIKSSDGFRIIKVTDHKAEVLRPLDEVRTEIEERLATQKTRAMISEQAARVAKEVSTSADLDKGAAAAGSKVQTSEAFTQKSPISGLGVAPEVSDAAFGLQDTTAVAGPIDTPRGPVFLALVEKKESYLPALDAVKEQVKNDLVRTRALDMSRQRAGEIAATLKSAKDFTAAAKGLGIEAKETMLIARGSVIPDIGVNKEVDAAAFALPVGAVSGPIGTPDGTAIIKVVERDEVTPEELAKDRETFRAEILNERRDRFFNAYMTKAKDRVKVVVYNDVVRQTLAARGL